MNEMVEENKLIKQAVLSTYERTKDNYLRSRNKMLTNQNNSKNDNSKQVSQSGKQSIQFRSKVQTVTNHSPNMATCSGNNIHLILKSSPNSAMSTNSVSTVVEETESQLDADAELDQTHELSPDCEAIMDILHPDIDYGSDLNSDELNYVDERLADLSAMEHTVSAVQPSSGNLATFDVKLFDTEPVTTLFDTGASCSCVSFTLYKQI